MKTKILIVTTILIFLLQMALPITASVYNTEHVYYLLRPENFASLGSFMIKSNSAAFGSTTMDSGESYGETATAVLPLKNGTYYVWIRTADYPEYIPAWRELSLTLNGKRVYESVANRNFGRHSLNYTAGTNSQNTSIAVYWWEKANSAITVTNSKLEIGVTALQQYAKFDAVLVTDDPSFVPDNPYVDANAKTYAYSTSPAKVPPTAQTAATFADLNANCTPVAEYFEYENELTFPAYAQLDGEAVATASLSNDNISLSFRLIEDENGNSFVQRQTCIGNTAVDSYNDGLGYLLMFADSATDYDNVTTPLFKGSYNNIEFGSDNVFKGGYPIWTVMTTLTQKSNTQVVMTGENDFAKIQALWTLNSSDKDPSVALTVTYKKTGAYSLGMFYSPKEYEMNAVKFIQVPYRYQELGMPSTSVLVPEALSTSNLSQATTTTGYKISGKDITYGIFVDDKSISYSNSNKTDNSAASHRWVKNASSYISKFPSSYGDNISIDTTDAQSNFGLSIRGKNGGAQPAAFAPVMSSADCHQTKGTVMRITYRPMATLSNASVSSWYDGFSRVIADYLKVTDYRSNYFASMTDTIFNIYDLLLDDQYGGWSVEGKGHYNMEARNVVSNAAPLTYLQLYLLTEDETLYKNRTVPSMEYILSRPNMHFAYSGPIDQGSGLSNAIFGSSSAFLNMFSSTPEGFSPLGLAADKGGTNIGNASYYGAYKMTMGQMPYYKNVAAAQIMGTQIAQGSEVGIQSPSEYLWKYKASGNSADLNTAHSFGATYINKRVNTPYTKALNDADFIYQTYYPNIHVLLEMYEQTKEARFLTAAQEAAHRLITTLWSTGMPESASETIAVDADFINVFNTTVRNTNAYWHGDRRFRLGEKQSFVSGYEYLPFWNDTAILQNDVTVPAWAVSRVGLGVEQTSTFAFKNANIIMSTWAADLMRISELTGDQTLETYARNSIVGRFANYPGYYQYDYYTFPYGKDFPYKGPDTTSIYYHHIPVLISALQDFLFSEAYAWSNGSVDFPSVRSQGYAWFSNRYYGFAPGKIFNESNMWLWMKKGLITVDNQQIDWFGARKDGRAAFVFTNASDETVTTNVTFGDAIDMASRVNSIIYTTGSNNSTKMIENKQTTVTVPPKTTVAIAFNANVSAPAYSKAYGTDLAELGTTYAKSSVLANNDVQGYTVQLKPDSYNAYISIAHRPKTHLYSYNGSTQTLSVDENGIDKASLTYKIGNSTTKTLTDTTFPFEFSVEVADASKPFEYSVTLTKNGIDTVSATKTLTANHIEEADEDIKVLLTIPTKPTYGTSISASGNPTISNWNSNNNKSITTTGNCFAFFKMGNDTGVDVPLTLIFTLYDQNNNFKRIAKIVNTSISASNTSNNPVNISTKTEDPIVLTENDIGNHFVVYVWSGMDTMKPYMNRYNFATGKTEE